jgi:monovalent cation/hydrogen antiporter
VRQIGLPRRLVVVLEGEGLANDATALILYRFAVAAAATGLFSFNAAAGTFALIVVGEIAYGIAVGWASLRLRRWARDPRVEITLSLLTPYAAFLVPEQIGGSGVLATVATGLYVSWNGPLLIPAATRLQGIFFWDLVVYFLEGFVFLITGMQIRTLINHLDATMVQGLVVAVVMTVVVVIAARFVWVYPAVYLPRWLSRSLAKRDPLPPPQWTFILGFVGVRGVVSLAAALAIPLTTAAGAPFPYRDLILFITFALIVVTLVGQGLMLPAIVRKLGMTQDVADERQRESQDELNVRLGALDVAQHQLETLAADSTIAEEAITVLRARHEFRSGRLPASAAEPGDIAMATAELRTKLITAERKYIYRMLQEGRITDEGRRRIERELDLEEAGIACKKEGGVEPPL